MSPTVPPAAGMHDRIRSRRRAVARRAARRRRRILLSAAGLVVLLAGLVIIARSPLFAITDVQVDGVEGERAEAVREATQLGAGDNLLTADLDSARVRVENLAWVRAVETERDPPSRLVLDVTPRRPVAVVELTASTWQVDAEGYVVAGGADDALDRILAPDAVLPGVGARVTDAAVRGALEVRAQLPAELRVRVPRYEARSESGLRLLLTDPDDSEPAIGSDGIWVRIGRAENVARKAEVVLLLLEEIRGQAERGALPEIAELDVRVPTDPVLVPETDPAAEPAGGGRADRSAG